MPGALVSVKIKFPYQRCGKSLAATRLRKEMDDEIEILEGPICADGLVFWKIESESIPGGIGWTAEGDGKEYYLEPYRP